MTDPFADLRAAIADLPDDRLLAMLCSDELGRDLLEFVLGELYVRRPDVMRAADEWAESLDDERTQLQVVLDYLASK